MKEWETTRIYIYEYMYNREQMYYNDLIQIGGGLFVVCVHRDFLP